MISQMTQPQYDNMVQAGVQSLYARVLAWLAGEFGVMIAAMYLLGPIVPQRVVMTLYLLLLGSMIIAAFVRRIRGFSEVFAIIVPAILGIALYSTLNYYVAAGSGSIVMSAAAGTLVIFGIMSVWGFTSKKSIDSWGQKLFFILLGVIAVSLLNAFVFHLAALSFVISLATVVIFSIYTFIDIQRVKKDSMRGLDQQQPASSYALNIFLNIYNLFVSLLNIFSSFR